MGWAEDFTPNSGMLESGSLLWSGRGSSQGVKGQVIVLTSDSGAREIRAGSAQDRTWAPFDPSFIIS